jgi:hypothetical protein
LLIVTWALLRAPVPTKPPNAYWACDIVGLQILALLKNKYRRLESGDVQGTCPPLIA